MKIFNFRHNFYHTLSRTQIKFYQCYLNSNLYITNRQNLYFNIFRFIFYLTKNYLKLQFNQSTSTFKPDTLHSLTHPPLTHPVPCSQQNFSKLPKLSKPLSSPPTHPFNLTHPHTHTYSHPPIRLRKKTKARRVTAPPKYCRRARKPGALVASPLSADKGDKARRKKGREIPRAEEAH